MTKRVTACILTKNEEAAITTCVHAAKAASDQVLVFDSSSTDRTVELAEGAGARIVPFVWDGRYPKKKQWALSHPLIENDWVLLLDADELVPQELAREIDELTNRDDLAGVEIGLTYVWQGVPLRHGHRVYKRCLTRRSASQYPEVGDLDAPGIGEVEGHYQPEVVGAVVRARTRLIHDDPDPLSSWISRHNRYSDWEAHLRTTTEVRRKVRASRSAQGKLFDELPFKQAVFFAYSYLVRLGFLDGRRGFDYAFALAWYYWLIGAKTREARRVGTRDIRE